MGGFTARVCNDLYLFSTFFPSLGMMFLLSLVEKEHIHSRQGLCMGVCGRGLQKPHASLLLDTEEFLYMTAGELLVPHRLSSRCRVTCLPL